MMQIEQLESGLTKAPVSPAKVLLVWVAFENYTHDQFELGACVRDILIADDDAAAVLAAERMDVRLRPEDRALLLGAATATPNLLGVDG